MRGVLRICSDSSLKDDTGLARAGTVIGVLERIFTVTLVLVGQFAALAVLIAAKSLVRFGESRDRRFAEYYLIGTMTSILLALLVALLARALAT